MIERVYGLSSQTHWRRFVMHLCRIFSLFSHWYQDVVIDRLSWRIEWVYLMTYQVKLIEEGSWCIFVEPFHCFYIHIKMWSIDSHGGSNEVWPNDKVSKWWNWMSLFDGLLSQTHWRRLVTHLCRTFLLFPHSYQDVVIDRSNGWLNEFIWWLIKPTH